jgi:hypothetical protein
MLFSRADSLLRLPAMRIPTRVRPLQCSRTLPCNMLVRCMLFPTLQLSRYFPAKPGASSPLRKAQRRAYHGWPSMSRSPQISRRCAYIMAGKGSCENISALGVPTNTWRNVSHRFSTDSRTRPTQRVARGLRAGGRPSKSLIGSWRLIQTTRRCASPMRRSTARCTCRRGAR